jgi:hypothetical protein
MLFGRKLVAGLAIVLFAGSSFAAVSSERPRAPCGVEPVPNYPALGAPPEIVVWTASAASESWSPPACTATSHGSSTTFVLGLAARFSDAGDADAVLTRIGAISSLRDVRYWSVTDKQWNAMFTRASALEGPNPGRQRGDFTAAELRAGHELYFLAADNRSHDAAVSRLRVSETGTGRILAETSNVTPLRWFFLSFAGPGDVQTWYFLEHETGDSWRFYSLTRVLYASPFFLHVIADASYINRALAMYRHLAANAADRDSPAAP